MLSFLQPSPLMLSFEFSFFYAIFLRINDEQKVLKPILNIIVFQGFQRCLSLKQLISKCIQSRNFNELVHKLNIENILVVYPQQQQQKRSIQKYKLCGSFVLCQVQMQCWLMLVCYPPFMHRVTAVTEGKHICAARRTWIKFWPILIIVNKH